MHITRRSTSEDPRIGYDFLYWLKRASGAKGALRAALARRPRAPPLDRHRRRRSDDVPNKTRGPVRDQHQVITDPQPRGHLSRRPDP